MPSKGYVADTGGKLSERPNVRVLAAPVNMRFVRGSRRPSCGAEQSRT